MFVTSQLSTLAAQPCRPTAAGHQDDPKAQKQTKKTPKNIIYRVVDGPIGRLGLTEAAVGDVSRGDGDVLTGAGEEQQGAVHDDRVPVPVLTAIPATTLHLQGAKQGPKQGFTHLNTSSDLLLSA